MRNEIIARRFGEGRVLHNLAKADVLDCVFAAGDGGSALKQARDVKLENCSFSQSYPLWYVEKFHLHDSRMEEASRAPMWYCRQGLITDSDLRGPKALRECKDITLRDCTVHSEEFGWKSRGITVRDSTLNTPGLFLDSRDVTLDKVKLSGSGSFRYAENATIRNSILDTADAFWHSRNVTVENCLLRGSQLGWFSEGLTLRRCKIIGSRPLCHCKELTLEDCVLEEADLAFEYSDVTASILGHVDSVRNIRSGNITADSVGDVITENAVMECSGTVTIR